MRVLAEIRPALRRRDSRYHSGRSRDWIKVKNMAHPTIERAMLIALSKQVAVASAWG